MIIKHYKSDPDELAVKDPADAFRASSRHSFVIITDHSCLSADVAKNRLGTRQCCHVAYSFLFIFFVMCKLQSWPHEWSGDSQSQLIVFLSSLWIRAHTHTHARALVHAYCTVEVIKKQWDLLKWALFIIWFFHLSHSQCFSACDIQYNYYWDVLLLFWYLYSFFSVITDMEDFWC